MYFSMDDMDYWYEIHGNGRPIVLLHGFTGTGGTWKHFIDSCPDGFQLITVDLPGHGKTKPGTLKTMDACIDDLHQLFQALKLENFVLVGYSMGGRTALSYAVKYPEMLAGLVLESASPGLAEASARAERRKQDELLARKIEVEGVQAFVDHWEIIPLFETQKSLPREVQEAIRDERLSQTEIGLANSLRGMGTGSQSSNWGSLRELTIPVLLLVGELDQKFVEINQKMQQILPNADMKVIADAGHAIHIEKPDEFRQVLMLFAKTYMS